MGPKKDKKKGEEEPKGPCFTLVEKTMLELQVADLNKKIAKYRTFIDEYEIRNEELERRYEQLDEDRADIIAYLKKTLNTKNEENNELKDKVKGLEDMREIETAQFKSQVKLLEKNFTFMKDQLTSENKMLAGKLNTLEEFRTMRDELMKKYEKQEQNFKDQEINYKRMLYDAEKKLVIGKDKLKKEMEQRLLQLAQDFQDATELRIAASTHRVIRENIAINNEFDNVLSMQTKLAEQNEKYKENETAARNALIIAEQERDKAIKKSVIQLKLIDHLTNTFQELEKERALYEKKTFDLEGLEDRIQNLTKENEHLLLQVRILEQNLHAEKSDQNKIALEMKIMALERSKLKKILKESAVAVKAALKLDQWAVSDPSREVMDRQILLSRLLEILSQYKEMERAESVDTLASLGQVYREGDLGFVPKPSKTKLMLQPPADESKIVLGPIKSSSISLISSSLESLKTIPSMKIVPKSSIPQEPEKESELSFVTSLKSIESEEEVQEEEKSSTSIERALQESKFLIQKSIADDLKYSKIEITRSKIDLEQTKSQMMEGETEQGEAMEDNDAKDMESEERDEGAESGNMDDKKVVVEDHQTGEQTDDKFETKETDAE
ncbi:Cilia- and flagella-associated protein 157 [Eumeta japonica]|uniref:Cilia- and flagella-associated protein 157 n=1 Tax=Eumeta variegata TaxID=151549 RepID=A0A4C1SUF5_EUMVA|nr:Cilia- and flagella-associated protein 157 [Eumeta japonica]